MKIMHSMVFAFYIVQNRHEEYTENQHTVLKYIMIGNNDR